MKSTRHIVKPIKGLWKPKHNVWFKKNEDAAPAEDVEDVWTYEEVGKGWPRKKGWQKPESEGTKRTRWSEEDKAWFLSQPQPVPHSKIKEHFAKYFNESGARFNPKPEDEW